MKKALLVVTLLISVCSSYGQNFNFTEVDPQYPTAGYNAVWPQLVSEGSDTWNMTKYNEHVHTAIWNNTDINLNTSFTIQFKVLFSALPHDDGADGIAFVLRNPTTKDLGTKGGAIGYIDIPDAFGIEFDTYCNNSPDNNYGDVLYDHVAYHYGNDPIYVYKGSQTPEIIFPVLPKTLKMANGTKSG